MGMPLHEVSLRPMSIERFLPLVGPEAVRGVVDLAARIRTMADGRRVWNVSSTEVGGGVAEMLRPLNSYARGLGIDARWVVIEGNGDFFRLTKRLHNALHGEPGDRSDLGDAARVLYESVSRENAADLLHLVHRDDVVLLHDPQTAGLAPYLVDAHAGIVWRCHIGRDGANAQTALGWSFLGPYLRHVNLCVYSRESYVPKDLGPHQTRIVMPSIDPFSAKNQPLERGVVQAILCHAGLLACPIHPPEDPRYERADGVMGEVSHCADVMGLGPPPPAGAPLVLQVSRWDALKDPVGVMLGFARLVELGRDHGAHLMLAGPNVHAVADDPDGVAVFEHAAERWRALPHEIRKRVHLATLPMHDVEENAAIVNALQRHATVVVQKSLHEGFGLTVTEAMWKGRPVVASAVGGLQDQILDQVTGLLLRDPNDLVRFGELLAAILSDPEQAARMGQAGHEHVKQHFLGLRALVQYGEIIERLDARAPTPAPLSAH